MHNHPPKIPYNYFYTDFRTDFRRKRPVHSFQLPSQYIFHPLALNTTFFSTL